MFGFLKRRKGPTVVDAARTLYDAAVRQARKVPFYDTGSVPDTIPGRFDMIILHVWVFMRALRGRDEEGITQNVFDVMMDDLDAAQRELGAGDTAVAKGIKRMAQSFYGRAKAYDAALEADDSAQMTALISRNVYGFDEPAQDAASAGLPIADGAAPLAAYAIASARRAQSMDRDTLFADPDAAFADLPFR